MYDELLTIKERNDYLNQKVNVLETTISSIFQRTITKEEMEEIIEEGLTPINNILLGKTDTPLFQTKTDDIIIERQERKIKRIEEIQEIEELNSKFGSIYIH